ncbi:OsmC family protein [Microbispora hainanensis]|uniref:OsmC family protein n=1 Tax=Microbispora hainanensis TaxID=568844 RepID=A0ABZ1SWI9_9ACTN|nr:MULTISPECIES: OsmC family protein [Microbispora]NJP26039.1 OsmC family protein [Microbispora sp. CL1-1]TQS12813.1 OsmC family protein [Microbispora sp. SCL1-1]
MSEPRDGVIQVAWRGADRFDVRIRRHVVRADRPPDVGGSDTGPTPAELFVGSVAAGVACCAERYLRQRQLPAGVGVTARYGLGVCPGRIDRIELSVDAPGLPEGLRASLLSVLEHCAVCTTLRVPPRVTFEVRRSVPENPVAQASRPTPPRT